MAMAMAVCKPLSLSFLPPSPPIHRARNTWKRINSQERSVSNASFQGFHRKRLNTRGLHVRASREEQGGKEQRNKEGPGEIEHEEDAIKNTDAPGSREEEEAPESKSLGSSPDRPQPVQQESRAKKEKLKPSPNNKLGFQNDGTKSRDEDLKRQQRSSSKRDDCCGLSGRLRCLWQTVRRPQNVLTAFLTGLLLYAIALFGWQVMVVAVDVTLFVMKCSLVAIALLMVYIFVI